MVWSVAEIAEDSDSDRVLCKASGPCCRIVGWAKLQRELSLVSRENEPRKKNSRQKLKIQLLLQSFRSVNIGVITIIITIGVTIIRVEFIWSVRFVTVVLIGNRHVHFFG